MGRGSGISDPKFLLQGVGIFGTRSLLQGSRYTGAGVGIRKEVGIYLPPPITDI